MKKFLMIIVLAVTAAVFGLSCQGEENEVFVSPQALNQSSQLTGFLRRVALADSLDNNVLDSADCFKIKLPVEVTANNTFLLVDSEGDYQQVAAIFNASNSDEDSITFGYPITIVYDNGQELAVTSDQQLHSLQQQCPATGESPIYCAQFLYPFGISLYDAASQTPQIVTITSGANLMDFIVGLTAQQYFGINYPITVQGPNGFNETISNNSQLLAYIIESAEVCSNTCTNPDILTDDLIMYIPFANGIVDLTGFGNPEVGDSNYHFVTDRSGNPNGAFSFDTIEATNIIQINATAENNLLQNNAFTISFWFSRQNSQIFEFEPLYTNNEMNISLGNQFNQEKRCPSVLASGMIDPIYDIGWIESLMMFGEIGIWHHIVVTYNGETLYLYRDGALQSGTTAADFSGELMGGGTFGNNYQGYIDDIRMYKRALNIDEINVLYQLDGDVNTCY